MLWKQPTKPVNSYSTMGNCLECSNPAQFEYCVTGQHEPTNLAVWIPLCTECEETNPQSLANTQWSSGLIG